MISQIENTKLYTIQELQSLSELPMTEVLRLNEEYRIDMKTSNPRRYDYLQVLYCRVYQIMRIVEQHDWAKNILTKSKDFSDEFLSRSMMIIDFEQKGLARYYDEIPENELDDMLGRTFYYLNSIQMRSPQVIYKVHRLKINLKQMRSQIVGVLIDD